ncbi:MAG: PAS domain-containing protein [Bacillota bacterium]|nr:PAS domain-containing protein [Bacillota bacterium]
MVSDKRECPTGPDAPGLDEGTLAVPAVTTSELAERMLDNAGLLEIFDRQVLRLSGVLQGMAGTFALVMTDAEGCCLRVRTCQLSPQDVEKLGLKKGSLLLEDFVGPCGIATTLVRGVPVMFRGPEHGRSAYHNWVTMGVPIHAQDGGTVGALGLYVAAAQDTLPLLDLLVLAGHAIEADLARVTLQQQLAAKAGALEAMQKETHGLFDALPMGAMVVNSRLNIVVWNHAAERITGLDASHVLGRNVFAEAPALLEADWAELQAKIAEALYGERPIFGQEITVRLDGEDTILSYSIHPVWSENQDCGKCLVLFEDVTYQRRLERRVRRTDEKMELVGQALDSLPFGVVITDAFGRIVYVNGTFQRKTGFDAEAVIGVRLGALGRDVAGPSKRRDDAERMTSLDGAAPQMSTEGRFYALADRSGRERVFVLDNHSVEAGGQKLGTVSLWDDPGTTGRLAVRFKDIAGLDGVRVARAPKEGLSVAVLWEQVRMYRGMTPAQFAHQVLDLNLSQYLRYEKGAKFPSLPNALALARRANFALESIYCLLDDAAV